MKVRTYFLIAIGAVVLVVFLLNASFLAPPIAEEPFIVAHRALGQPFKKEGLTGKTCTAARMIPASHSYLENTIPSMEAAFEYGASYVEFDVHRTLDNQFAVFHDWTLDCRTDSSGTTREHTLETLQSLDIGYGYTADGGQSWPFRGTAVGAMPSLEQVLTTFPDRNFIIDFKSNDREDGALLAERLLAFSSSFKGEVMVTGGPLPVQAVKDALPETLKITRPQLRACLTRYITLGWVGIVPTSCQDAMITVPLNIAPWLWGWPNRFLQRMASVNSKVILIGPYRGEGFSQGVDNPDDVRSLPSSYAGGIWTDRIDLIAPAITNRLSQ